MEVYLLVANKVDSVSGGYIPARTIVERRFAAGKWPLFKNTPHQNRLNTGDKLIVYLAGLKNQCFVASAEVAGITSSRGYDADGADALTSAPFKTLLLRNCEWFDRPRPISVLKKELSFVPQGSAKWGCVMQRGLKKINSQDALKILRS